MAARAIAEAGPRGRDRVAGAFVLVVMAIGCAMFWIGIPIAVLRGLGEVTGSSAEHFIAALVGVPAAMLLFLPILGWLNVLYLRVTGVARRLEADEDESGWQRRLTGPLEPMMIGCLALAIVALFVWFFFFAENPSISVI